MQKNKILSFLSIAMLAFSVISPHTAISASLSKKARDAMSPQQIENMLFAGNIRFLSGKPLNHNYRTQQYSSQFGQHPAAIALSCIDSRVPVEIVLDAGIGDLFSTRIAGNVEGITVLGGMEFATKLSGAKLIIVMGHTRCGAVQGAIANVKLGNLTALLAKIKPAIPKTIYKGNRSAKNYDFVDAVSKTNVQLTIESIRKNSPIIANLEKEGKIKIVGAMYNIATGKVTKL